MHSITTAISIADMMMGIMLVIVSTKIDCYVLGWCRGMLVAVPHRDSLGMHGIPAGTGGGDHSSGLLASGRRGDPGGEARAGSLRRGGGGCTDADGEEERSSSERD